MPYLKKELGRTRERHLFVQGVPFPIPEVSLWRGQIQKERIPKAFAQVMGSEYMLPDLNKALIPRARSERTRKSKRRR